MVEENQLQSLPSFVLWNRLRLPFLPLQLKKYKWNKWCKAHHTENTGPLAKYNNFFQENSAVAKQLPGCQMRPIKWWGDPDITKYWSDWQPKNLCCQSPGPIVPDDAAIFFQYFYVAQPKICVDHPTYQLGGPLGDTKFFVSCSTEKINLKILSSKWQPFGSRPHC